MCNDHVGTIYMLHCKVFQQEISLWIRNHVFFSSQVAVRWEVYERVYREYYDNGSSPDEAYFTIDASAILFLCECCLSA